MQQSTLKQFSAFLVSLYSGKSVSLGPVQRHSLWLFFDISFFKSKKQGGRFELSSSIIHQVCPPITWNDKIIMNLLHIFLNISFALWKSLDSPKLTLLYILDPCSKRSQMKILVILVVVFHLIRDDQFVRSNTNLEILVEKCDF